MLKVIKVRLYPTLDQQHTLSKIFGSVRFVYNLALSYKIEHYNIQKQQGIENIKYLNYNGICKEFKDIRANWYNTKIIEIDRYYPSSKKCSNCNNIKHDLTLNDRIYHCIECGFKIDRDLNAAINIKSEGLRLLNL